MTQIFPEIESNIPFIMKNIRFVIISVRQF